MNFIKWHDWIYKKGWIWILFKIEDVTSIKIKIRIWNDTNHDIWNPSNHIIQNLRWNTYWQILSYINYKNHFWCSFASGVHCICIYLCISFLYIHKLICCNLFPFIFSLLVPASSGLQTKWSVLVQGIKERILSWALSHLILTTNSETQTLQLLWYASNLQHLCMDNSLFFRAL